MVAIHLAQNSTTQAALAAAAPLVVRESPLESGECFYMLSVTAQNEVLISVGSVLSVPQPGGKNQVFKHDAYSHKGMSGSPIFDANNLLVGFHIGKDRGILKRAASAFVLP